MRPPEHTAIAPAPNIGFSDAKNAMVERGMEAVQAAWDRDSPDHFPDESTRLRSIYSARRRVALRWDRRKDCVFPGCTGKITGRSHSLPRSSALRTISESGHVLGIETELEPLRVFLRPVGVREASTFPGFCPDHERLFAPFERRGMPGDFKELGQQFFRIACRELRAEESSIEQIDSLLLDLDARQQAFGLRHFRAAVGGSLSAVGIRDITFRFVSRERRLMDALRALHVGRRNDLHRAFVEPLASAGGDLSSMFFIMHVELSVEIPVCLAGRIGLHAAGPRGAEDFTALLLVWPRSGGTCVAILAPAANAITANEYVRTRVASPCGALSLVEDWMIHGTDHWFIRPSVWAHLPEHRREHALAAHIDFRRSVGGDYEGSIFDELRHKWLADHEAAGDLGAQGLAMFQRERDKLGPAGAPVHPVHRVDLSAPGDVKRDYLVAALSPRV